MLTDEFWLEEFRIPARKWIDRNIGIHRDDERTDEEVESLARELLAAFKRGQLVGYY